MALEPVDAGTRAPAAYSELSQTSQQLDRAEQAQRRPPPEETDREREEARAEEPPPPQEHLGRQIDVLA